MLHEIRVPSTQMGAADLGSQRRCLLRSTVKTPSCIGVADTDGELGAIGQLRFKLYVARDGKAYAHADWEQQQLIDPIDDCSLNFQAVAGGRLLAAVRLTMAEDARSDTQMALLVKASGIKRLANVAVCSRFVAEPSAAARKAIVPLFIEVYRAGLKAGARLSLLATRPRLDSVFAKFGYRYTGLSFEDPVAGNMHVLCLDAYDVEHLNDVRSPFLEAFIERFREGDMDAQVALPTSMQACARR